MPRRIESRDDWKYSLATYISVCIELCKLSQIKKEMENHSYFGLVKLNLRHGNNSVTSQSLLLLRDKHAENKFFFLYCMIFLPCYINDINYSYDVFILEMVIIILNFYSYFFSSLSILKMLQIPMSNLLS